MGTTIVWPLAPPFPFVGGLVQNRATKIDCRLGLWCLVGQTRFWLAIWACRHGPHNGNQLSELPLKVGWMRTSGGWLPLCNQSRLGVEINSLGIPSRWVRPSWGAGGLSRLRLTGVRDHYRCCCRFFGLDWLFALSCHHHHHSNSGHLYCPPCWRMDSWRQSQWPPTSCTKTDAKYEISLETFAANVLHAGATRVHKLHVHLVTMHDNKFNYQNKNKSQLCGQI